MPTPLEVIYEDNHLLVVNKPPELATMGAESGKPSLVQHAKEYLKQRYNKPGNVYLGVVSRLDSFTSGIVVLARTSKAAGRLSKQFADRSTQKYYLCATAPIPQNSAHSNSKSVSTDTPWWDDLPTHWQDWIWHDDANHRVQAISVDPKQATANNREPIKGAKLGKLNWGPLGTIGPQQLNLVRIMTGRKHQIRVQFASRSCPILGDRKYESQQAFSPGIALHAWLLGFRHPVGDRPLAFFAPLPKAWKKLGRIQTKTNHASNNRTSGTELPKSTSSEDSDSLDSMARQWQAAQRTEPRS